jgi:uncharacterized membrane protein YagU involved in acid resistance
MRHSALTAIVLGGFTAGTIDIGSACLINMLGPIVILHSIASGLLGKASFAGGLPTATLGLVLQWAMSIAIAAIYVLASRELPVLVRRWIPGGLAYGVAIYVVMTFVVVPLSAAPFGHRPLVAEKAVENLVAMLLFGLIVAFFARRSVSDALQPSP